MVIVWSYRLNVMREQRLKIIRTSEEAIRKRGKDNYDKTITKVASGGHENSLNLGIKRAKNWYI